MSLPEFTCVLAAQDRISRAVIIVVATDDVDQSLP